MSENQTIEYSINLEEFKSQVDEAIKIAEQLRAKLEELGIKIEITAK